MNDFFSSNPYDIKIDESNSLCTILTFSCTGSTIALYGVCLHGPSPNSLLSCNCKQRGTRTYFSGFKIFEKFTIGVYISIVILHNSTCNASSSPTIWLDIKMAAVQRFLRERVKRVQIQILFV